jgi:hypothetical protein
MDNSVSKISDLLASAKTVRDQYEKGRMERETVREWVFRLGSYPSPHGDRVREASEWFRAHPESEASTDTRRVDIVKLKAIHSE